MLSRSLTLALAVVLFQSALNPLLAAPGAQSDSHQTANMRAAVAKRGVGSDTRIQLQDGSEIKGQITQISAETFAVQEDKTRSARTFSYHDVKEVKGKGLSRGAKIGIGVAIAVGAAAGLTLAAKDSIADSLTH